MQGMTCAQEHLTFVLQRLQRFCVAGREAGLLVVAGLTNPGPVFVVPESLKSTIGYLRVKDESDTCFGILFAGQRQNTLQEEHFAGTVDHFIAAAGLSRAGWHWRVSGCAAVPEHGCPSALHPLINLLFDT